MIITLTLNPAFDVHAYLGTFRPEHENLAESVTRTIGGKGINISRALTENGINNKALVFLGRENEADFIRGLQEAALHCQWFSCDGRIRENITVHPADGAETRLSFKGFRCDAAMLSPLEQAIPSHSTVTFSGSLPQGISPTDAAAFLIRLKDKGVRLVLDSKSLSLEALKQIQPWLIKPNAEEMEAYCGITAEAELKEAALALHRDGIENVLVSLGKEGAILAGEGQLFCGTAPPIHALSTVGAGDSMIAGFLATDAAPEERLKTAIAYGSAACLREGTAPPLKKDIDTLLPQIHIH